MTTTALQTNTFFCQGHLTDRPIEEQNKDDPRYCDSCREYFDNFEVPLLSNFPIKPKWLPKVQKEEAEKSAINQDIHPITPPKQLLHTVKTHPSASGNGKRGRPRQPSTPYKKIIQLSHQGKTATEIFEYLQLHDIKVSRRTVYNIIAGQRSLL